MLGNHVTRDHLKSLLTILFVFIIIAFPARAAETDLVSRRNLHECQNKAAEYTYNLGKPGDPEIFAKHVQDCMEARKGKVKAAGKSDCSSHPMTFTNNSGETVWIGVWEGTKKQGFDYPEGWTDWQLAPGDTKQWCAPKNFNGRFVVRTGCVDGKCEVGDCCASAAKGDSACSHMKCSGSTMPATLAEFTFDSSSGTWYNASYV
ncbi:MAG: hypothetical protein HQK55_08545, partial [Deltaproteobacteria bacterium]|nr:hypothetical protein [Deltaproteobacteria bacterium]